MSDPASREPFRKHSLLLCSAVSGLVLMTIAGRFGRFWWPVDFVNHLAVYFALFGVVSAFICAVLRRWWFALLAGAVAVFYVVMIQPQLLGSPVEAPSVHSHQQLRLAHLNVLRTNRDKARVVAFLNTCNADAVFIQEAHPWWVDTLRVADIPYHETSLQTDDGRFGIMMLMRDDEARVTSRDVRLVSSRILNVVPEELDRPAIEAVFTVGGQEVSVLSVHPAHPVSARLTRIRDQMLRATREWADNQDTPHVVIGDFNTTPWSYAFSILTEDEQLISTLDGRGNQGTGLAGYPVPVLLPIDHCLHSTEMVCLDRAVGPFVGSDHLPLCVTLALDSPGVHAATKHATDNHTD